MKRKFAAPFVAVALGVGFCTLPISAQTQTAAPPAVIKPLDDDPLAGDTRLKSRFDYRCEKAKLSDVLSELRTYTSARLVTMEDWGGITLHVTNASVRDVMDSIAALRHGVWKREGEKWTLSLPKSGLELSCHPGSAEEAEEAARCRAFLDAANQLPQEVKDRLDFPLPNEQYGGVLLSELPKEMQNLAQSIYQYERPDDTGGQEKLPETLRDCKLHMTKIVDVVIGGKTTCEARDFMMEVGEADFAHSNSGGVHARFYTQTGPKPDYSVVPRSEVLKQIANETAVWPEEPKKSREAALAQDKRMNQPITLEMNRYHFLTAIQTLARVANISVATRAPFLPDNLRTFHFNKTPLHEALDQIAAAYGMKTDGYGKIVPADKPEPDYADISPEITGHRITINGKLQMPHSSDPTLIEWGWRKSGIFLFTPLPPAQSKVYLDVKEKIAKSAPTSNVKPASSSK